jgi:excisionase family DNA binding protein
MPEYYTTEEAAEILAVTPSRIRQFIGEGRLKSQKYGRDHLIQATDLYEFKKTGKKKRGRPNKNTLRKR